MFSVFFMNFELVALQQLYLTPGAKSFLFFVDCLCISTMMVKCLGVCGRGTALNMLDPACELEGLFLKKNLI